MQDNSQSLKYTPFQFHKARLEIVHSQAKAAYEMNLGISTVQAFDNAWINGPDYKPGNMSLRSIRAINEYCDKHYVNVGEK